jgi:sRNA-binding regulator protein Hfq
MRLKSKWFILIIGCMAVNLAAMQSFTFLHDGNVVKGVIVDMSSRNGQVEYLDNMKVNRSRIWMINYIDGNYDFPRERSQLSNNTDTVFLRNGGVIHDHITDFSSRRLVWEFMRNQAVHESQITRIYFCCTSLPPAFNQAQAALPQQSGQDERYSVTFLVSGKSIEVPLSYMNSQMTGFTDGKKVNTPDVWMINFENNKWDFADERRQLNQKQDTIFLKDGEVIYDTVTDFNKRRGTFQFKGIDPIHESQIKRIYFCCNLLPNVYRQYNKFHRRR